MKKRIVTMIVCATTLLGSLSGCGATKSDFTISKDLVPSADLGFSISGSLSETDKPIGDHNPIASNVFFADPTSVEYEGRLYVYGTCDQQEYDAKGGFGDNSYGAINTLACYSTDDMVNWTYHGVIPVTQIATWAGCSWAPSIVKKESGGKTKFYLYFANSAVNIGVLTSDSPTGPWEDPVGGPVVDNSMSQLSGDPVSWCFDPGVVVDDDGVGWIAFGGGDPHADDPDENAMDTGNCRIARLSDDMLSIEGEVTEIHAPYHFEANELNYINGTWVLTYCSNYSERMIWPSDAELPAPSGGSMCYMTSTDPLNSDSWVYKGEYCTNPNTQGYPFSNNHSHLQKYGDKYYMLYQNVSLLENMGAPASGFRSIGVNICDVDESTATFGSVKMDDAGVEQLKNLDVFAVNQAETAVTTAGVKYYYDDECVFVTEIDDGDWSAISSADFGKGANQFAAKVRGDGIIEIRIDSVDGEKIGEVQFETERGEYTTYVCELTKTVSGVHDLYFVYGGSFVFDEWQFAYVVEEPAE